ncbi:MAG: S1 RNA-binding domain-containing protein, partial [Alphaproteobacteria bacterium]
MAKTADTLTPTRADFEALLAESFGTGASAEGSVVKGRVVAIENDYAIIDVGLKTEGRIALKEFSQPGKDVAIKVG